MLHLCIAHRKEGVEEGTWPELMVMAATKEGGLLICASNAPHITQIWKRLYAYGLSAVDGKLRHCNGDGIEQMDDLESRPAKVYV